MDQDQRRSYWKSLAAVIAAAVLARALYYTAGGLRFDHTTIGRYFQFVDPPLLQNDLLRSVLHLHSQPPGFNFLLGLVLKAFPNHYPVAFHLFYLALGLVLIVCMFHLMLRVGVPAWLAAVTTGIFAVSPVTALFENWLYTTYPMAAVLVVGALLLHRYATDGRMADGVGFFSVLAVIVLTRGFFHLVWFLVPAVGLLVAKVQARQRTLVAMSVPLSLLIAFAILQFVHFRTFTAGKLYQEFNLAQLSTERLPRDVREKLIADGKISGINRLAVYHNDMAHFFRFVPPPPATGIAVLDQHLRASGVVNWHSLAHLKVAEQYGRDARYVIRHHPRVYFDRVLRNAAWFFLPADQSDPFLRGSIPERMSPLVRIYDLFFAGQLKYQGIAWLNVIGFPLVIVFGARLALRNKNKADALVAAFIVYNFVYIAAVTILLSSGDHSRYRFKSSPLVVVLIVMLAWRLMQKRRSNA